MTKISEPGIYDISLEKYHSDCCDAPSISGSGMHTLLEQNPQAYWWSSYLNPNREEIKPSRAMLLGSAAHHLLLGQEKFSEQYVLRPEELAGYKWNSNRTEHKRWLAKQAEAGKTVLLPSEIDIIRYMRDSLAAHPAIKGGLINGDVEKSMIFKKGDVWVKSRPDVLPSDAVVADLKTTADTSYYALQKSIEKFGYGLKAAVAADALLQIKGIKMTQYHLVFVRTSPPYDVAVHELSSTHLHYGMRSYLAAVKIFEECLKTGNWHGSWRDTEEMEMSSFYRHKMEAMSDAKELPPLPMEWKS
jgi:hypothetical protein